MIDYSYKHHEKYKRSLKCKNCQVLLKKIEQYKKDLALWREKWYNLETTDDN